MRREGAPHKHLREGPRELLVRAHSDGRCRNPAVDLTVAIDQQGTSEWLGSVRFIYLNQPSGARSLLSTIAGSVMNVAGVVFSLTIIALTLASQQFGPRLLGNFMRDRGNQLVLGTFVATFLYCLLILRTMREESGGSQGFVPHLSVAMALLIMVGALAALNYLIHHIAASIQVQNVIGKVAGSLGLHSDTGNQDLAGVAQRQRAELLVECRDKLSTSDYRTLLERTAS
jgi:hypothetical protein